VRGLLRRRTRNSLSENQQTFRPGDPIPGNQANPFSVPVIVDRCGKDGLPAGPLMVQVFSKPFLLQIDNRLNLPKRSSGKSIFRQNPKLFLKKKTLLILLLPIIK